MNRRTFLAASAALAAPAGLRADPKAKPKVKFVSSLPRTGSAQGQTDSIVNAIRMAIEELAEAVPFAVELVDLDDAVPASGTWEAEKEKENATAAVADADVLAYFGPYNSGAAKVSAPILNEAGLVQVTPSATYPGLTKAGAFAARGEPEKYRPAKRVTFFRVCPHDASHAPLAAKFAVEELKAKSAFVIDDGMDFYGGAVASGFVRACEALKVKVVARETADPLRADYDKLAKAVAKSAPALVYFGGTTQSGGPQLVRALAAAKCAAPLLLPDGCYERAFLDASGETALAAVPCFVTTGGVEAKSLNGAGAEFVKRYKAKYKKAPEDYAAYGYEAAAVVLAALAAVGKKDRAALLKEVARTKDFAKGVLGKWSFDADGDTTLQQITVSAVEKGEFKVRAVLSAN
jgi:branched-chain amino acid transport system substrate-binding protein